MQPLPVVTVAPANAREIRTGAAGAELERAVVDGFARGRVGTIAFGLAAEWPNHLRVAAIAAFADVHVPPGEAQRRVGLDAFSAGSVRLLDSISGMISTRPPTLTASDDQHHHQVDAFFDCLRDAWCLLYAGSMTATWVRLLFADRLPDVVGHDEHAGEEDEPAQQAHP